MGTSLHGRRPKIWPARSQQTTELVPGAMLHHMAVQHLQNTEMYDVFSFLFFLLSLSFFYCWLLLLLGAIIIDWKRFSKGTLAVISCVKFIALGDEIYWLILFFFSNTVNCSWTWHYFSIINFIMYTWFMGFVCARSLPLHLHYACFKKIVTSILVNSQWEGIHPRFQASHPNKFWKHYPRALQR